mmetsp:Transcript_2939/g.4785  ORF Transcript_2939/g.4785 Transcript_2939/m.4785 type:complete len:129 (-) Transcript_2939:528-914(-)
MTPCYDNAGRANAEPPERTLLLTPGHSGNERGGHSQCAPQRHLNSGVPGIWRSLPQHPSLHPDAAEVAVCEERGRRLPSGVFLAPILETQVTQISPIHQKRQVLVLTDGAGFASGTGECCRPGAVGTN